MEDEWFVEEMPEDEKPSTSAGTVKENRDPLKWFGMSVPSSLRDAQRSFRLSIPLIVELANRAHVMHLATDISAADLKKQTE